MPLPLPLVTAPLLLLPFSPADYFLRFRRRIFASAAFLRRFDAAFR